MQGSVNIGGQKVPAGLDLAIFSRILGGRCLDPNCEDCGPSEGKDLQRPDIKAFLSGLGISTDPVPDGATVVGITITKVSDKDGDQAAPAQVTDGPAAQTAHQDSNEAYAASIQDHLREQIEIQNTVRKSEDRAMADLIEERIRTLTNFQLDADFRKGENATSARWTSSPISDRRWPPPSPARCWSTSSRRRPRSLTAPPFSKQPITDQP